MRTPVAAVLFLGMVLAAVVDGVSAEVLQGAVLPASRSVQVGRPATAFATLINDGSSVAVGCSLAPGLSLPAAFSYQATDPATNRPVGSPNTPVTISAGASQTFVFSLTPNAPFAPTDLPILFSCADGLSTRVIPGVNTFFVSASSEPRPDVIAIAETTSGDGIVTAPSTAAPAAFAVAAVNAGAGASLAVSLDTGALVLPVSLTLCRSDSGTGLCLEPPARAVTVAMDAGSVATFTVFVSATGSIPLDPATSRTFVRFTGPTGEVRGSSSVAVTTGTSGWSDKVTSTPSLVQTDFGKFGRLLPLDGEISCGETAIAMSALWLGKNGFTQLAPFTPTDQDGLDLIRIFTGLAEVCFYTTTNCGNTVYEEEWYRYAVGTYLSLKGIGPSQVRFERKIGPDVTWLDQQNQNQSVVNFAIGWYAPNKDGVYERNGQHWLTLLDQAPGSGVLTINNPYPASLFDVANLPTSNPQDVPTVPFSHETSPRLPPGSYIQTNTPEVGPSASGTAVLETGYSWTIDPSAKPGSPGYAPQPFTLAPAQYVNNYKASLDVLAPLAGAGGLLKYGPADLILTAPNTSTGLNQVQEGLLVGAQASGTPFGTGGISLGGDGGLKLAPRGAAGGVAVTAASGAGSALSYAGGNRLVLDHGAGPLTLTIGGFTDGATPNLVRTPGGSLIVVPAAGLADLGAGTDVRIAGTAGNLPPVSHGMVTASIVGQGSDAGRSGAFLTYGPGGFTPAPTVSSRELPIIQAAGTIYALEDDQFLPPGRPGVVYALAGGPHAVTSAPNYPAVLTIGSQAAGDQAGVILNGTTLAITDVNFGAAEGLIYTSLAGGTISSRIVGTGGLTLFGPGTLTLTGANAFTGTTAINSGKVVVANTAGAGLTGDVTVAAGATLSVQGKNARVTGPVSVTQDSYLVLDGGTVGAITIAYGGYLVDGGVLEGHGTVAGPAVVTGTMRAGASPGTTTFQQSAAFSTTYFYWTLTALDDTPANRGIHWNALDFQGKTEFGYANDPVFLLLEFRGIPDPNSGHPFWTHPHRWLFAQFNPASSWQAWYDYENFDYAAGSFSVELANDQAQLVYTPTPPGAAPTARAASVGRQFRMRGR